MISSSGDSSDFFFDAFDDFFTADLTETTDPSPSSTPGRSGNQQENEGTATSLREGSSTSLRQRRASSRFTVPRHSLNAKYPSCESHANSEVSSIRERRSNIVHDLKDGGNSNGGETSTSTLTSVQNLAGSDLGQGTPSRRDEPWPLISENPSPSLLVSIADLVIKAVFFQVNVLIKCSTLSIWLTYNSLLFVANPLGALKSTIVGMKKKVVFVCKVVLNVFSLFVPEVFKREHGIGQLAGRLLWCCFWSFYVGIVLFGLLVTGFFFANLMMSQIVEKPLQMTRNINFDYTKASPDALVQLMPCDGADCSLEFNEKAGFFKLVGRAIPPNHKLHLTVSLTLPESDYNRNLGVFQVRVQFLSVYGKVTSSVSKPCMLKFKSSPIRFMETFIRSGPLLAGYSSESQVVDLILSGFTEGPEPTLFVRIILEQRAEYRPGAGIPEIYSASIKLMSELPLLKRIIWNWRRLLLIWSAIGFFFCEMLIVLVCCKPTLFPCGRRIDDVSPQHTIISSTA